MWSSHSTAPINSWRLMSHFSNAFGVCEEEGRGMCVPVCLWVLGGICACVCVAEGTFILDGEYDGRKTAFRSQLVLLWCEF